MHHHLLPMILHNVSILVAIYTPRYWPPVDWSHVHRNIHHQDVCLRPSWRKPMAWHEVRLINIFTWWVGVKYPSHCRDVLLFRQLQHKSSRPWRFLKSLPPPRGLLGIRRAHVGRARWHILPLWTIPFLVKLCILCYGTCAIKNSRTVKNIKEENFNLCESLYGLF